MTETEAVILAAEKAHRTGQTAILATVVAVAGSSYRLPGARMLVTEEGWRAGSVSGGCLEADIVRRGEWLTGNGQAVMVTYDTTDDDDIVHGLGLGCRGIIQVLIERLDGESSLNPVRFISECMRRAEHGVIVTIIDSDDERMRPGMRMTMKADGSHESDRLPPEAAGLIRDAASATLSARRSETQSAEIAAGEIRFFAEYIRPPVPLVIFGAGHDVIPLAEMAKDAGFSVTVADHRSSHARHERFPRADRVVCCAPQSIDENIAMTEDTLAIVMTHRYECDRILLSVLLASPVVYIGLLGPRKRAMELLDDIAAESGPIEPAQLEKLHAPVGLDIGAANAQEVAVSILAELLAICAGRHGGHLKNRESPIHSREDFDRQDDVPLYAAKPLNPSRPFTVGNA